jgi:ABC-type arginine/histidine transport system permease subunit
MSNFKFLIAFLSATIFLAAFAFPVSALEYNVGVTKGAVRKVRKFRWNRSRD